jgi:hypothetical protein
MSAPRVYLRVRHKFDSFDSVYLTMRPTVDCSLPVMDEFVQHCVPGYCIVQHAFVAT